MFVRHGLVLAGSGVVIGLAIDNDIIIIRGTLPPAYSLRRAVAQIFALNRVWRKIRVTLDDLAAIALGDDRSIPDGARHLRVPVFAR
jgi:hypothetical protein